MLQVTDGRFENGVLIVFGSVYLIGTEPLFSLNDKPEEAFIDVTTMDEFQHIVVTSRVRSFKRELDTNIVNSQA